jgi:hypothetical protein
MIETFTGIEKANSESPPWDDSRTIMSCAVVASDGRGNGVLLHHLGPAIDWAIDEIGRDLGDLGLSDSPAGVWVWTGTMGSVRVTSIDYGEDWDWEVTGDWREPTAEEWETIKDEDCPWTPEMLPRRGAVGPSR